MYEPTKERSSLLKLLVIPNRTVGNGSDAGTSLRSASDYVCPTCSHSHAATEPTFGSWRTFSNRRTFLTSDWLRRASVWLACRREQSCDCLVRGRISCWVGVITQTPQGCGSDWGWVWGAELGKSCVWVPILWLNASLYSLANKLSCCIRFLTLHWKSKHAGREEKTSLCFPPTPKPASIPQLRGSDNIFQSQQKYSKGILESLVCVCVWRTVRRSVMVEDGKQALHLRSMVVGLACYSGVKVRPFYEAPARPCLHGECKGWGLFALHSLFVSSSCARGALFWVFFKTPI